jgi:hypothetical protein
MPKNTACPGVPPVTDPITDQKMAYAHLKISRDQILDRLWELANLSHEVTRGIIAGQMRALTLIVAIEGLIPDRRSSSSPTQPQVPPVAPDIYVAEWLRKQQNQASEEPATTEAQHGLPLDPNDDRQMLNRVPQAKGGCFGALLDTASSPSRSLSLRKGPFARRR